jgi:hypothetical protein
VDPFDQQVGKGGVHGPLPGDSVHPGKGRGGDLDREMAFATFIVAGVASVHLAVVSDYKMCRIKCLRQASGDFISDRTG